jgi:PAS domain S-box-containing protein
MQAPPVLENESQRLHRLQQLGMLDTGAEALLDAFTELAAAITGLPIALITLVDRNRQWFKSAVGLPQGSQTPRAISFCGHAIAGEGLFEVEDARLDPRFADNPLVTGSPLVTHYAGAPLVMPSGERIGTLCVIGDRPGRLDERARQHLLKMAQNVVRVLLLRENERSLEQGLKVERALRESEARWHAITELLPQIIWSANAQGEQEEFNQRWLDFTGESASGRPGAWMARVHGDDQENLRKVWAHHLKSGRSFEEEFRLWHHSGGFHWILARALPMRDDSGRIVRWIATLTDIQTQKQAQLDLIEINRQKDEFLAMLAHELRNPLAPVSTAAQLLQLSADDPQRVRKTSELIARQVRHMTELVNNLLDVSRVTRGLVRISQERVDLRQVLGDALEQSRPQIEARHHQLEVPEMTKPLTVMGDSIRLVQVLANLLGNAAKYTPEGGQLKVKMEICGERVSIEVSDNGIGIDAKLLPHVFDLFTQAERMPDRAQGGLGVGLALVRSLVELHGGTIQAHSDGPGTGSTFTVYLPLAEEAGNREPPLGGETPVGVLASKDSSVPTPPSAVYAPAAAQPPPLEPGILSQPLAPDQPQVKTRTGLAVMVVDDNADAADLMGIWLESQGHEVRVCLDPLEALAAAHVRPAKVYVLDIGLPGMDGNSLARRLREDPRNRDATLIALTGYGQAQDILQSKEAGFDQHFVKPADPSRLAAVIDSLPRPGGS